ncbi:8537_t:CDS:2 [Entrophospora sp. SA101]|nr:9657_t:CDS:2 [Entrophospora sp. SA101]CAJ0639006.1 8537_t:CDS:2 [Entrophospora sp. SA101]CAJ0858178.1 13748_t:CDS:2 [Entrophospora sp. SA101]CAJ0860245.1 21848_t:CDS:2 [Entrophospora sp. SA101]
MTIDRRRIQGPELSVAPVIIKSSSDKKSNALVDENGNRLDGRDLEDIRKIYLKTGLISQANGSAYIELNQTKIACGVYGPRQTKFPLFSGKGTLNCELKFAPFSCLKRRQPYRDVQERDLSQLIFDALSPSVRLELLPKSTIDIFINVLENDGTTSCLAAAITCASVALADAGIEMLDLVAACSASFIGGRIFIDSNLMEEQHETGSLILSYMPSLNEVTHILQSGEVDFTLTTQAIEQCTDACNNIYSVMNNSLMESAWEWAWAPGNVGTIPGTSATAKVLPFFIYFAPILLPVPQHFRHVC